MPRIVVVPHSAIVVRRPETADLQPPSFNTGSLRARLGKRGIIFPSRSTDAPKASNVGIDLVREFFRRSQDDQAVSSSLRDDIFGFHAKNEQRELRKCKTEGDLRGKAKLDISRPIALPSATDRAVSRKYRERQADWKRRSNAIKNKQTAALRGKRFSLETWKMQSGRCAPDTRNTTTGSSDVVAKPLQTKKSMSFRCQRWSFRSATDNRCQRWSFRSATDSIVVAKEPRPRPPPPTPKYRSSGHSLQVAYQHGSVPKKAASMGSLRPHVSHGNHLTVPTGHGPQHPIDQRHIHPALRTEPFTRLNPSPRPTDASPLRPQPAQPLPRVRVIPPSMFIPPHELTTAYSNHSIIPSKPPTIRDQRALLKSLNAARAATLSVSPLDLHPLLSNHAQDHVALHLPPLPPPKAVPPGYRRRISAAEKHTRQLATKIEAVEFKSPSGANAIRLISPPGLGALACGELWASGKYKRHKTVKHGQVPEKHRFTLLPGFEASGRDSMETIESESSNANGSAGRCPCAEYDSWKVVTDGRWKCVGIGRAEDGRWVVELWEPDANAGKA